MRTEDPFATLRQRLAGAAEEFGGDPDSVAGILTGMVDDVDRAVAEPLEIFPVCHHSPASALAMVRRLEEKQPKVIYLELCEDLRPILDELRNCQLPVAIQAFASELDGFSAEDAPLSLVAPITQSSAEFQAIAYALETPGVELVLVDRSTDHFFQTRTGRGGQGEEAIPGDGGDGATAGDGLPENSPAETEAGRELHGEALGVEIGDLRPRFAELEAHLLHHGKVRHWSEWWDQYVEQPLADADYDTYRQVMVLIGSLFRRLRPGRDNRLTEDEDRERHMWTRIRQHLATSGVDRSECLHVCGAFHAASRVEQFGTGAAEAAAPYTIPDRTGTRWLYGVIPSSHSAIEAQFGLAPGSVSIASATWAKGLRRNRLTPRTLAKGQSTPKGRGGSRGRGAAPRTRQAVGGAGETGSADRLSGFLSAAPHLDSLDEEELLGWCVDIVRLARRNGYLSSTADAIAVFESSLLLANLRDRARPTPYDFQDAAVTCIEKESVPGRRDVRTLCEILLGGDRLGQVGYSALPPLARDVYDRLAPLGLDLTRRTQQRALMDLAEQPHLRACSHLLWMLRYLLPAGAVRPIMGERRLGEQSIQESWDLAFNRHQRSIIELGYEGVTVEQVLEQRLRRSVRGPKATAAVALAAVEDSLVLLDNRRFTEELGRRAVELLATERTVDEAPEVLRRIRRLLGHYRNTSPTLPAWCEAFVTAGYAHYCTLLPTACLDEQADVRQVAAMLGFLFSMESLALSLGCDQAQLELAVAQCHPETPAKIALLWAAEFLLGRLTQTDLRARCAELLGNPLVLPGFPQYISGFIQALEPAPTLAPFVVETISKAFGRLPDAVLLPWLPHLITTLRDQAQELVPILIREAGRTFPGSLAALDSWTPPWEPGEDDDPARYQSTGGGPTPAAGGPAADLLRAHPQSCDAVAALLGCEGQWRDLPTVAEVGAGTQTVRQLLASHPLAAEAIVGGFSR